MVGRNQTLASAPALSALHNLFDTVVATHSFYRLFPIIIVSSMALIFIVSKRLSPTIDPREPPVVWPRTPLVGHIVSLLRESTQFYARIYKQNPYPICTLPMLNGKLYLINSPSLISSAMRNKDLSFEAHAKKWAIGAVGLTQKQYDLIMPAYEELNHTVHSSLTGDTLYEMNAAALRDVAATLNRIDAQSGLHVPDAFLWLRDLMSMATMKALFGDKNPLTPETVSCLWDYEKTVARLALNVKPDWTAGKGLAARTKLQSALAPYFVARHDQRDDSSDVIRKRSEFYRKLGFQSEELGTFSFDLPWASTTNTIPILFWLFVRVFSVEDTVNRIREEVIAVTTIADGEQGGRTASVDITRFEKACPYIMGCYREALRLYSDNTGQRQVLEDTVLSDPNGKEYLLKKGCLISWSPGVVHLDPAIWGEDATEFNPDRWVNAASQDERRRRAAFIPFGGGRNLCPGRMFAQAELLGFVSAVAMGFTVEGVHVPPASAPYLGTGARRPAWGRLDHSVDIKRRKGWENVNWKFIC